jgi:spoIIIJ-associated protein
MASVEASGKTVEEAIELALEELGAERDEVEVEVLSEPRGGVLGVGGAQARVRVWIAGEEDEPADDGADDEDEEDADAYEDDEQDERQPGAEAGVDEDDDGEYVEDEAELAAQMLDKLLELMGVQADVSIRDPETPGDGIGMANAVLEIEGDDLGVLIGRRGETLTSLQYLLNLMAVRRFGQQIFFSVDVEGYRRRRERSLMSLARRTADQVRRTRRPVTLEPMPANERRIIHIALADDRQVTTESVGEGDERKVSVTPRRAGRGAPMADDDEA